MKWKYLIEFHNANPDFRAMYHYNDLDDFFKDCLYGDLHYLSHRPDVEFLVSNVEHDDRADGFFDDFMI